MAIAKQELLDKVLSLGGSNSGFNLQKSEETDIVISWDYEKAYALLLPISEKELKKKYRAYILLDESKNIAKIYEESTKSLLPTIGGFLIFLLKLLFTGKAKIGLSKDFQGGSQTGISMNKSYSIGQAIKTGSPKAVDYTFNNIALKKELKRLIKESGWAYKTCFLKGGVLKK